jgi:hypothetical protein
LYHRTVSGATASTLNLPSGANGLGVTSSDYITFQTGGATQSNSIVIDGAGRVSVLGRTNLIGRVSVGKNFEDTSTANSVQSVLDISGVTHMSSATTTFTDNPRIKLLSNAITSTADIPSFSQTANEIRGMNTAANAGFLRLTGQSAANSCIDLTGTNTHSTGSRYNNSVRIGTNGIERMIVNGSGNVGIGTNAPSVALDVVGAAKISTILSGQTGIILGDNTKTAMESYESSIGQTISGSFLNMYDGTKPRMEFRHPNNRFGIGCSDAEAFIWSYNAKPIAFGTSNNVRMRIMADGKVGIGIDQPTVALDVTGEVRLTGNLNMTNTRVYNMNEPAVATDAATKGYVDGAIPIGGIIMWSGTIASIPSNWRLCNGSEGTPDLLDRFVIGARGDAIGFLNRQYAHTYITGEATMVGGTKNAVVVAHSHDITDPGHDHVQNPNSGGIEYGPSWQRARSDTGYFTPLMKTATNTTGITINSQGVSGTNQNLPPYYALAFIMRVS